MQANVSMNCFVCSATMGYAALRKFAAPRDHRASHLER